MYCYLLLDIFKLYTETKNMYEYVACCECNWSALAFSLLMPTFGQLISYLSLCPSYEEFIMSQIHFPCKSDAVYYLNCLEL